VKREWLLLTGSVVVSAVLAVGLIRLVAPDLLLAPVPVDRRVMRLDKALPPFYDGVFDPGEQAEGEDNTNLVNDPLTGHRRRTLVPENSLSLADRNAPIDLLGFRNRAVPVVADVVTIGDSQTLGENATLDQDWPSVLKARLGDRAPEVYSMAVAGWGPVQYLYMFDKALRFRPRAVVVAFYTGNDPADALYMAYAFEPWKSLRGQDHRPESAPSHWPPEPEDQWPVAFSDGIRTVFTAATRLTSNDRAYPGTAEGYRILLETARRMDRAAADAGVALVFTVIPTKELVFAPKVHEAGLRPPPDYARLVDDEAANIAELAKGLSALGHAAYVDVVTPLQRAALAGAPLYAKGADGHPAPAGYAVIAAALAPKVGAALPAPPGPGLVFVPDPDTPGETQRFLIRYGGAWRFANLDAYRKSGWAPRLQDVPTRPVRDLAEVPYRGPITAPDPEHFGPAPPAP
jgi:lysophospholipase L1-like esterase